MSCDRLEENLADCNCTYPCSKKGKCCECVAYHRRLRELPGCFFSEDAEATYDRSYAHFARIHGR